MTDVLKALTDILEQRKGASPDSSYVAQLHHKGLNKILEKVGEEAFETVLSARDAEQDANAKTALVGETADLWFHSLVMLSHLDLSADDVLAELARRFDMSGLEEKANRSKD